ncbi:hypothetical protein DLM75_01055 [Leptospira stimsonii]|uniref:Uncharacterized protein n=1 Tax=Leptospira stimsonii TaxID=2202203 RepID=A0A396ZEF9_9LEPT|nr:hypothetical protein DLM75_01055 [Leptospira stimsonii]
MSLKQVWELHQFLMGEKKNGCRNSYKEAWKMNPLFSKLSFENRVRTSDHKLNFQVHNRL